MFNNEINKTRLIVDMIDRFIVRGRNSDYDIDVLICGTVNDYVWIKKYDLILSKRCLDFTSPHVACMTICPKSVILMVILKMIKIDILFVLDGIL